MNFTIDRIENGKVVLENENGDFFNEPFSKFCGKISDGDIVTLENNVYRVLKSETENRMDKIKSLRKSLEKK